MFHDKNNNLHPFTFHVVLEWVLDTVPEKRLITGIAVKSTIKNTSGEDEDKAGLAYVLYTYEHDNNGYFTVENLPLYDEKIGEARDLNSLEDFLIENKRDFIKYSQSSGKRKDSDYYRYLESRGILRSEWMTLKEINKSEGGISDYFGKASDNKSIFDKIIIPAISQNIRNYSSDDGNTLIEMFRSNLSITKDLPILLKRENDYRELNISIDPLIENADSGVRFIDRRQRLINEGNDILFILNDEMEQVNGEVDKWRLSLKDGEEEKRELSFKKDNLLYNKDRLYFLERQIEIEKLSVEYSEVQVDLEDKKAELTSYKINKVLYKKEETESKIKSKILERDTLINNLDIEDSMEKVLELDTEIEIEWEKVKSEFVNDEIDFHGYMAYTDDLIAEKKNRRNKYKDKKEDLQRSIDKFEVEKESLGAKKDVLLNYYDIMSLGFPERILEDLNLSNISISKKRDIEEKAIEYIETRTSSIKEEKNKEEYIIAEKQKEVIKLQEEIKLRAREELDLAKRASKLLFKEYDGSLLDETWFSNSLDKLNAFHRSKLEDLEHIKRVIWEKSIQKSLNNEDYFIPNMDLITLKESIKKMNIHVETGTEYLYSAGSDEIERILKDNPGFIYSLVISDLKQWEIIAKNTNSDILLNSMVPIYIRSEMGKAIKTGFKSISSGIEKLVDREYYYDWKEKIEKNFNDISNTHDNISDDIECINEVIKEITLILRSSMVCNLSKDLKLIEAFIQEKWNTILSYEEELSDLNNKWNIKHSSLEKIKRESDELEIRIHLMEEYIYNLKIINERQIVFPVFHLQLKSFCQY